MTRRALGAALLLLSLGACVEGAEPTAIVVLIDSDMNVPGEIDGLEVSAQPTSRREASGVYDLTQTPLPATVLLLPGEDLLVPVLVTASARKAGQVVVVQQRKTRFLSEKVLLLRMRLLRGCAGKRCAGPDKDLCAAEDARCRTCVEGGRCGAIEISELELEQIDLYSGILGNLQLQQ